MLTSVSTSCSTRPDPALPSHAERKPAIHSAFVITVVLMTASLASAYDQLGTATITKLSSCPSGGLSGGTCYQVTISDCPESTENFVAAIKVNLPSNTQPVGAVFFTPSGGGGAYYDNFSAFSQGDKRCNAQGNCGLYAVQTVVRSGYETLQTDFSDPSNSMAEPVGWLTGPSPGGPRALACRYATLVHAVWIKILGGTSLPVCATGNSGGAAAVAYALTEYGLGDPTGPGPTLSMAEPTSGPPMSRLDKGCSHTPPKMTVTCPNGDVISEGYEVGTALKYIDPSYDGDTDTVPDKSDICSEQIQTGGDNPTFLTDSILSGQYPTDFPETFVNSVFGSNDLGAAVPQGLEWWNAITSSKAQACVAGASHQLASTFEGATKIANDLITSCKLR
jgi:hypothetical protein